MGKKTQGQSEGIRGRGTAENIANRFESWSRVPDPEGTDPEDSGPKTQLIPDQSRSIISTNDSPDIGFSASLNPYRGCEHGCVYCYARPTHEYLGFSSGLDFETRILVKTNAPELLRQELSSPRWKPQELVMSGVTDPYQPAERELRITRRCLEVLLEFRNPVAIITKNELVTRDINILRELARFRAVAVFLSITSLDPELRRVLEPRTAAPLRRLAALRVLRDAGIPAGVMAAPIIPALNESEVPSILRAAAEAGARFAGHTVVRLPHGVAPLFEAWLERHFPEKKKKVLDRIRAIRGGRLNDPRFGHRMRGEGIFAEQIHAFFRLARKKAGIPGWFPKLSTASFRPPGGKQGLLF